jgi:DNA-binding response OmpR family regulator
LILGFLHLPSILLEINIQTNKEMIMAPPARSIVVIDDQMELTALVKAFLEKEAYRVIAFVDPAIALEYFSQTLENHSLIITDMRMLGICGTELAKKVRKGKCYD